MVSAWAVAFLTCEHEIVAVELVRTVSAGGEIDALPAASSFPQVAQAAGHPVVTSEYHVRFRTRVFGHVTATTLSPSITAVRKPFHGAVVSVLSRTRRQPPHSLCRGRGGV
jgi:hypothetical protein